MAAKEEEFDVLTFFIYVMVLLTVFVGGFALLNYRKVSKEASRIATEVRLLDEMQKIAVDEDFRDLVARDREARAGAAGGALGLADFQQKFINEARRNGLRVENHSREGVINRRTGEEYPFRLIINDCKVRDLVKFLVAMEENVPGCRVKQIVKLDFDERSEVKGWDAVIVLSLFKAQGEG